MKVIIRGYKAGEKVATSDSEFNILSAQNETQMRHLGLIVQEAFLEYKADFVIIRRIEEH